MEPQNWGSANIMWQYYHDAFPCCKLTFSVSFSDSRALFGTSPRSSSGVRFMTCTTTRASTTSKTTQTYSNHIFLNMACVCRIPIAMADLLVRLLMTHLLNHSWIEILLWSWIVMNRFQNDLRQCIFQWETIDHKDSRFFPSFHSPRSPHHHDVAEQSRQSLVKKDDDDLRNHGGAENLRTWYRDLNRKIYDDKAVYFQNELTSSIFLNIMKRTQVHDVWCILSLSIN